MARWLAVVVALGCGTLGGCVSGKTERSTARLHGPPLAGVVGEDVVYLDVFVLERPLGDSFFNRELWTEADEEAIHADGEQAISLERKTVLEKNGFRVGQLGGALPPTKLQDLLTSHRSCQGNRIQLHAGHETKIPLGPLWPRCRCRLVREDQGQSVDLAKGQCLLEVVPTLADEGRVHLRFTPQIKHGDVRSVFESVRDADGLLHWGRQEKQPEEVYPWLDWTLTVAPNEFVVVGALLDRGETLGEQFFLSGEDNPGVQYLLVLRAVNVPTPADPTEANADRSPPLAQRASLSAVHSRGE
jgi:hypothetical protein